MLVHTSVLVIMGRVMLIPPHSSSRSHVRTRWWGTSSCNQSFFSVAPVISVDHSYIHHSHNISLELICNVEVSPNILNIVK